YSKSCKSTAQSQPPRCRRESRPFSVRRRRSLRCLRFVANERVDVEDGIENVALGLRRHLQLVDHQKARRVIERVHKLHELGIAAFKPRGDGEHVKIAAGFEGGYPQLMK